MTDKVFTPYEFLEATGISYRQLDYWASTGYLIPSVRPSDGPGTRRLFNEADYEKAVLTKVLLDLGVALESIRGDGDPRKTIKRIHKELSKYVARAA